MRIEKRHNRYFLVHILPKDVQRHFGKTRFTAALRTADLATAKLRAAILEPTWRSAIAEARAALGGGAAGDARAFWQTHLEAASDDGERTFLEAVIAAEATRTNPAHWRAQIAQAEPRDRPAVEALAAEEAEMLAVQDAAARGVFDELDDAATARARAWFEQATGRTVPMRDHLDRYMASLTVETKTAAMRRRTIEAWLERHPLTSDVTRRRLQAWIDGLAADGAAPATVKRCLSEVRGFWRDLVDREIAPADVDPFLGLRVPKASGAAGRPKRAAWTPAEVAALHRAARDKGDQPLADVIAIAAYTGMRIEEIANLRLEDVNEREMVVHVAKTDAGVRTIPTHPALRPLVRRLKAAPERDGYLIVGLKPNQFGDRSGAIGKRFGRLKRALGYPRTLVFHSIRKTVAGQLHDKGVPEQHAAPILGHKLNTLGYGVYSPGPQFDTLAAAVCLLEYPDMVV